MRDEKGQNLASEIAKFIEERKGEDVTLLDVSESAGWADYFIIATVTSLGHLKGVARELWGFLADKGIHTHNRGKRVGDDGWELIDCGDIIIHLMSSELRQFYALEKLWHQGEKIDFLTLLESK